jgi:predicted DNA-binding transcriptional regulator AlpA
MSNNTKPRLEVAREARRFQITGVPKSSWYDLMKRGAAPKPIPLSPGARGWLVDELEDWVERRRRERDDAGDAWQTLGEAATRVVIDAVRRE